MNQRKNQQLPIIASLITWCITFITMTMLIINVFLKG